MSSTSSSPPSTRPDINRGPEILIICGVLSGLATMFVLLRIWVRVAIIREVGWDDHFIVAAAAVMLSEMVVIIPEVSYGAGRHVEYIVPASNIVKGLHLNFVTQPLCLIGLCFTKISVGLFLLRITPSLLYRRFIWGMIIFTALSATGNLLTVMLQCTPLAFVWDRSVPGGKCISPSNLKSAAFFNSGVSLLTDIIFALLPIPMLWNVQMSWRIKAAVASVLSLGIFASASAIVKMTFLSSYGLRGDFLWDSADITIWTTVEICTAMIAASIPSLKPLFRAVLAGSSFRSHPQRPSNSKGYPVPSASSKHAVFELHSRRSGNVAIVSSGWNSLDNESEDLVLATGGQQNGITRTTEVSVSVS